MAIIVSTRPKIFYGWWIALACAAITATSGGVSFWSFGVLILPLEQEFGWLRGEIAGAFSVSWVVQGLTGPFVGKAVDRYGARPLVFWGTVATGLCFVLLATTTALWQFYLFHVLLALCRSWMFYIPLTALLTRWFVRRRSVALAISTSGFAVGGVVFVPLVTLLANTLGWRWTYLLCGAALYVVILPLALWVLRNSPTERGLTPDGDPQPAFPVAAAAGASDQQLSSSLLAPRPGHVTSSQWTMGEALRTRAFWLFAGGLAMIFMTQISLTVHAIPLFVSRGLTPEAAAGIVSASTAIAGLLRVPFGYLIDRTPRVRLMMLLIICAQSAGLSLLLASADPVALWSFVVLWGFIGGGLPLLESAFLFRTFGDRHFGALLGASGLVGTGGTLIGPVAAGAVFDATGSYFWALVLFLGATALALGAFLLFSPPKPKAGG